MALLDELLAPISDASFCGEDGSYDPDFEAARNEADKSTENNYAIMEEASKRFLTKKSKDMRALGYLALATAMNDGLDSFGEAVTGYCRLVMEHWDDIHPKRPTARANALKWLNGERNVNLLAALNGGATYETLQTASDKLGELLAFCDQKFTENPPSFGGFIKLVKEMAEKHKPKPVETASTADSSAAAAQSGPAQGPIASTDDAYMSIQNGAYWLLENSKTDAFAYRIIRMLKWAPWQEAIPNTGGRTHFPAPYPHVLEAYRGMFDAQAWADLAKGGEDAFSGDGMGFWFDLQRFICTAMAGLGPEYSACSKAIRTELALLLSRLPTLPNLSFEDGTPFADPMTQEWIQSDVLSLLGGGGGAGPAPIKKKGDVGEEQKQASILLGEGKLEAALHVLRTGLANDSSEKNNFDRKLIMAELLYKGNKPHVARSLLEDLKSSIAAHSLAEWDPELCVSTYHLSQKVFLALMAAADEGMKHIYWEKAVEVHAQISKLDPVLAISADLK
ncbi:MAG: type VI secretion system protein TssA [Fibrobacteres bacterium]|nr:type VI secretion system protein TssA [Fibrobacterota bacterium]